jgi:hypothetical protein
MKGAIAMGVLKKPENHRQTPKQEIFVEFHMRSPFALRAP